MARHLSDKKLIKIEEDKYYPNGDNKRFCNYAEAKEAFNFDGKPLPTTIKNGKDQGEFIFCMNKITPPNHYCAEHKDNETKN